MNTEQIPTTHNSSALQKRLFRSATGVCGARASQVLLAALLLGSFTAGAQTTTQSFTLQNGWNAIYLEVMPSDGTPANLFAGLPMASVWTRVDKLSAVDFIQDPAEATFNQAGWLRW